MNYAKVLENKRISQPHYFYNVIAAQAWVWATRSRTHLGEPGKFCFFPDFFTLL